MGVKMRIIVYVNCGLMGVEEVSIFHKYDTMAEIELKAEDIADRLYVEYKDIILAEEAENEGYNFYEQWNWDGFPIKEEYNHITDEFLLEEAHRIGIYNFFDIYCDTED